MHPEDRDRVARTRPGCWSGAAWKERCAGHKDEYRFVRPDGAVVWLESDVSLDMVGGEAVVRGSVRDVTTRKQAEEALRESEERMQMALEVSHSFAFEWEPTTDQVLRSDSCGVVLGLSGDGMRHDTGQRYFHRVHPDDRDRFGQMLGQLKPSASTYRIEYRVIRGDGTAVVLEESARGFFDVNGNLHRLVGVTTDITEHKRAEEAVAAAQRQVQSIIDNTPAIVYAFDLQERFLIANTAVATLLHSTPEQMIGKRRHEFMPKDDADWHEANDRQVVEAGRPLEFEEYSHLKDRSITWLTTKFPLRGRAGEDLRGSWHLG